MLKTTLGAGLICGMLALYGGLLDTEPRCRTAQSLGNLESLAPLVDSRASAEPRGGSATLGHPALAQNAAHDAQSLSTPSAAQSDGQTTGHQPAGPAGAPADALPRGKPIHVKLADGRLFSAQFDRRTDQDALWLRWQRGGAYILREIEWHDIASVQIADEQLEPEELRAMVQQVRRDLPPGQPQAVPKTVEIRALWPADQPGATPSEHRVPAASQQPSPRRVRWLDIEVQAANWDADVETDGLLVHLLPRDQSGRIVPVRGTVHVELWARRWGVVRQAQAYGRIGHWSKRISADDFAGRGALVRLPFQAVRPETVHDLDPRGAVHVRLAVPGQGTFEATDSMVRLRPYSAVRDRMQQDTGRRFFPRELIGAGPR